MFRLTSNSLPRINHENLPATAGKIAAVLGVIALLVVVPTPLDAALIVAPAAAAALLVHPFLLPLGLIASVPVQDLLPVPAGIPLTGTRTAVLAAVTVAPLVILAKSTPFRFSRFIIAVGLLIAVFSLSLWNAGQLMTGYAVLYHWLVGVLAFWLVIQFVRTRERVLAVLGLVAILAFTQGLYGMMQAVLGIGPSSFEVGMGFFRAYGTLGMPNSYAAYMETVTVPLIPVTLWSASHSWQLLRQYRVKRVQGFLVSEDLRRTLIRSLCLTLIFAAGAVAGLGGLAMSFSRGGWIGIAVAVAVMLVLLGRRVLITSTLIALIAAALLLLVGGGTVTELVEERVTETIEEATLGDVRRVTVTTENFAVVERLAHWQTAIAMWQENQWLGVGAGNFNARFEEFAVHPDFDESQGHAHNYYLHLLAESGLAGLFAYLIVIIAAMDLAWRAYGSSDALARATGVGAVGMTVMLTTHNFFENLHVLNISVQIMAIWALAAVAVEWRQSAQSTTASAPLDEVTVGNRPATQERH